MIVSRTPFRVSFFGGGTDYPAWYRERGGAVLATSINKYCYLMVRHLPPFFEHRIRIVYSQSENCQTVDEIRHPAVREVMRFLKVDRGVMIHHDGDLPARSGVGSSSAFTVGLMHALYALKGQMPPKQQLARESMFVEQECIKDTVGSQDQVLAAYGGFNHVVFTRDDEIIVRPMTLPAERIRELSAHLLLCFTGIKRTASDIAQSYVLDVRRKEAEFRRIGAMVDEGIAILNSGQDIERFGRLLDESWRAKRSLSSSVSNAEVEAIYMEALRAGALGGKLLGAGGGGFMLLFVPPRHHARVLERLKGLIHVPFLFESSGSQIIFFEPEDDYAAADEARWRQRIVPFRDLATGQPDSAPLGTSC